MNYRDWYVVTINMNKERGTKAQLLARKKLFNDKNILNVEYLERKELVLEKGGTRKVKKRLLMSGYILIQIKKEQIENVDGTVTSRFPGDTFKLITETNGVKGFVNCDKDNPIAMRAREVKKMFDLCDDAHLEVKQNVTSDYNEGDILDVVSGPFAGYKCEVVSVQGNKILGQLDMFDRSVPAEFTPEQVCKNETKTLRV